jgi:hypothetical protein
MRAPVVLVAALASAASLITAVPASAAPPPPVQGLTVTSTVDTDGRTLATLSWSPTGPETDRVLACAQQGVHASTNPNTCDVHDYTETTSVTLYLASSKTYTFSVFAQGSGENAGYSEPVTTQPWHGSKVSFHLACRIPTFGEPCRFLAVPTDKFLDNTLQGAPVELWRGMTTQEPDWRLFDTDRTNGDGEARLTVTMHRARVFQWRFQGVQGVLASRSVERYLEPHIKVTAHLSRSSASPGEKVKIYGNVRPSLDGLRIDLVELMTTPCRAWQSTGQSVRAKHQHLPNGKTTFGYVMTVARSTLGTHRFEVRTANHSGFTYGLSDAVTLTVGSGTTHGSSRNVSAAPTC